MNSINVIVADIIPYSLFSLLFRFKVQAVDTFIDVLLSEYMEDRQSAKLVESEYNQFLNSGESAITLEQLRQDNGL